MEPAIRRCPVHDTPIGDECNACLRAERDWLHERIRELEAERDQVRISTLIEAAELVCPYCGSRAFPTEDHWRKIRGPNESGNYYHQPPPPRKRQHLCPASAIWHQVREQVQ